jgi:F-type H+-transporting ATPase subunit a
MSLPGLFAAWAQHGEDEAHGQAPVEAGHEAAAEGNEEPANLVTLVTHYAPHDAAWAHFLHRYENTIFSFIAVLFLSIVAITVSRRASQHPGRLQTVVEMTVEGLDNLVRGLLGKAGRNYTPYLGTLFLYILTMNMMGLIPLMKAPTTSINTTAALALCTFLYVQYTGIRKLGIGGYLHHLAGSPRDTITWILVPFMLPLHLISELAKPLTLALRLFGNISGEDILVAAFISLGVATLASTHLPIGFPWQIPFIFLGMFFSTIQALVFTLLSTVYLLMMQPHEHEAEAH